MGGKQEILDGENPAQNPKAFRQCLGQFATGVTVMTTAHEGQLAGMSVNSFAALSLDPPLVLWSIRRESSSLELFQSSGHYAVNILAQEQVDVSNAFAKPSPEKFGQVAWQAGHLGAPLLAGAIGTLECTLENVVDGGDHFILIGRVQRFARRSGKPLLFVQGRYGLAEDLLPAASVCQQAAEPVAPEGAATHSLLRQFHFVSHLMSSRFDQRRQRMGVSVGEFRSYGWLMREPMHESELRDCLYLGEVEFQEALAAMRQRNHLVQAVDGKLQLTEAGLQHARGNAEQVRQFENGLLSGTSDEDLAATLRVLGAVTQHAKEQAVA